MKKLVATSGEKMIGLADNKTIEYYYKRLWEFTESVLLSTKSPLEFEDNYEVILAKKIIEKIKLRQ